MIELADIATNESHKLKGFKILGVFPFYLKYIRTDTHIQLCKIQEQIRVKEPKADDFYNYEIQSKVIPLINEYCLVALLNNRPLKWFYKLFLKRKIKACSHKHILNLYATIRQLDEPAFFLAYWKMLNQKNNTLLSEEKQS